MAAAIALPALVVPGALVWRAARADVVVQRVPEPEGTFEALLASAGRSGRMELHVGPFPRGEDTRFALHVLVGASRATNSFVLELLDRDGERLARCTYLPGEYLVERHSQETLLSCPVAEPDALRTVVVAASAGDNDAAIRVRRRTGGRYEGGGLVVQQPRGLSAALERLSVARASAFGAATMISALALSIALLGGALLLTPAFRGVVGARPAEGDAQGARTTTGGTRVSLR